MIPALRRQRQVDLLGFKARLVYKANDRTARATQHEKFKRQISKL